MWTKNTFEFICAQLRPRLSKKNTIMRKCIPLEKRIAICLWHLATGEDFRSLSWRFGIGKSTARLITHEVCDAIVHVLLLQFIQWPTDQRLHEVVQRFREMWNFPQCVGTIDGTHIPILTPSESSADYYNRKGFYSVIMQAMVDHEYK